MKRIFIVIHVSILTFSCFFSSQAGPLAERKGKKFSLKEKLWATKWINEKLSLLMEDGLVKKIKCSEDDSSYEVFVSSSWQLLGTEEKRDFLRNLSRAREITQHSPYLVIKDVENEAIVAQVDVWGILIFGEEREHSFSTIPIEEESIGALPQMEYGNNGIVE